MLSLMSAPAFPLSAQSRSVHPRHTSQAEKRAITLLRGVYLYGCFLLWRHLIHVLIPHSPLPTITATGSFRRIFPTGTYSSPKASTAHGTSYATVCAEIFCSLMPFP